MTRTSNIRRVAVIKCGALGDVVRTSYLLPGLRAMFEGDVEITWITAAASLPLLRFHPGIDYLLPIESVETIPTPLFSETYDWVISLDDERVPTELASRISARRQTGAIQHGGKIDYTEDVAAWFDMGLISHRGKSFADQLKVENHRSHNAIFSEMLGIPVDQPSFFNGAGAKAFAARFFRDHSGRKIGFNLTAGGRWPSKQMPPDEAVTLVRQIVDRGDHCFLCGGAADREYLDFVSERVPGTDRLPIVDLNRFAALIESLDLLVSSDSLALHLAIAQRVPTVSFFSPTSAAEIDPFGLGEKVISLAPDYCSYSPRADNSSITAERILAAIEKLESRLPVSAS